MGHRFKPRLRPCIMSLSKNINPSLELVQPRKIHPFITERLLMGCKELNQTKDLERLYFLLIYEEVVALSLYQSFISEHWSNGIPERMF